MQLRRETINSGRSRISERGERNYLLFHNFIFVENCMKMKEFRPREGGTFLATQLGSANDEVLSVSQQKCHLLCITNFTVKAINPEKIKIQTENVSDRTFKSTKNS